MGYHINVFDIYFHWSCIKKKKLVSYVQKYDLVSSVVGSLWYIILKVV